MTLRVCMVRAYLQSNFETYGEVIDQCMTTDEGRRFEIDGDDYWVKEDEVGRYIEYQLYDVSRIEWPDDIPWLAQDAFRIIEEYCDDPTPPARGEYEAGDVHGVVHREWKAPLQKDAPFTSETLVSYTTVDVYGSDFDDAVKLFDAIRAKVIEPAVRDPSPEPEDPRTMKHNAFVKCYLDHDFMRRPEVQYHSIDNANKCTIFFIDGRRYEVRNDVNGNFLDTALKLTPEFKLPDDVPACARKFVEVHETLSGDFSKDAGMSGYGEVTAHITHFAADQQRVGMPGPHAVLRVYGPVNECLHYFYLLRRDLLANVPATASSPAPATIAAPPPATQSSEETWGMRKNYWS